MRKTLQLNKGWRFQKGISEVIQIIAEDEQLVDLPHTWNATYEYFFVAVQCCDQGLIAGKKLIM